MTHLETTLERAYKGQRRTTRYLASQMARLGAPAVKQCLQVPVDNQAPTALTFRDKEEAFARSGLLLHRAEGVLLPAHIHDSW